MQQQEPSKPDWFNELHDMGLCALSHEWQDFWAIKNKMPEYKEKTWDILRDLQHIGIVEHLANIQYRDETETQIKSKTYSYRIKS